MFVLGIDPGLARTGYGLVRDERGRPSAVAAGVIRTDPSGPVPARLLELYRDLTALLGEHGPDVVAIERVFTNRNLQTATSVGQASGVAMLAAAAHGLAVHEYTPSMVKRAVVGYGRATKAQVGEMVRRRLRLAELAGPADVADALGVALCHLQTAGLRAAVGEGS